MQPFNYDKLVDVPTAVETEFHNQLVAAAVSVGHPTLADALGKLAAVTLPVDQRYLASAQWVREWTRRNPSFAALGAAAQAVLDQAVGTPFLLHDDAGTVAHVWFDGAGLRDSKANAWTLNGAVPQVAPLADRPPGAGPFSDANYYSLGAGADVLDFAGDFSACMVVRPVASDLAGGAVWVSNGSGAADGYYVQLNGTGQLLMTTVSAAVTTANGTVAGQLSALCFGRAGTTTYAKLNLGALATTALTSIVPALTTVARLGRYPTAGFAINGVIYEAWFSTTTPSDALFTQLANDVKRQLGITAW